MKLKDCIREGFGLLLAGLCMLYLYPYILAMALSLALQCQVESSITKWNICVVMEVLSMIPTAFIIGLIVSWFWKTREVRGSLIASILMGAYLVGMEVTAIIFAINLYPDGDISRLLFNASLNLRLFGSLVMLFLFSFCAAKLIQKRRCLKSSSKQLEIGSD